MTISQDTERQYEWIWGDFVRWCKKRQRVYLPASDDTILAYMRSRAKTVGWNSIVQRRTAIFHWHLREGYPLTEEQVSVREGMRDIRAYLRRGRNRSQGVVED